MGVASLTEAAGDEEWLGRAARLEALQRLDGVVGDLRVGERERLLLRRAHGLPRQAVVVVGRRTSVPRVGAVEVWLRPREELVIAARAAVVGRARGGAGGARRGGVDAGRVARVEDLAAAQPSCFGLAWQQRCFCCRRRTLGGRCDREMEKVTEALTRRRSRSLGAGRTQGSSCSCGPGHGSSCT